MRINYKIQGAPNSPVLVFSNSLGADMGMWDEVTTYLLPYFRVLRYDTRGHGGSDLSPGPYTIDLLGQDVLDLLDSLGIGGAYFCGLSMGGLIGQWLGIHHPQRIIKLIISNTAAKIGTAERWNDRITTVTKQGLEAVADSILDVWFTGAFHRDRPERWAEMKAMFLRNDALGYTHCCAAIRDADFREELYRIPIGTLVITGDQDPITDVGQAEFLASRIPHAYLKVLPARHIPCTELPLDFAQLLLDFLVGPSVFERGMHVRRTVLGDAHVNQASANTNFFKADFQKFITKYAWGEIWSRPGLSKRDRSLVTLGMLIALNRKPEFKLHIKGALHNGVTETEIREVIMQSALYCGLPAANEAFHAAWEVLEELGSYGR